MNGSSATRTGTLTVAGKTITVTQNQCGYTVSPTTANIGASGGSQNCRGDDHDWLHLVGDEQRGLALDQQRRDRQRFREQHVRCRREHLDIVADRHLDRRGRDGDRDASRRLQLLGDADECDDRRGGRHVDSDDHDDGELCVDSDRLGLVDLDHSCER